MTYRHSSYLASVLPSRKFLSQSHTWESQIQVYLDEALCDYLVWIGACLLVHLCGCHCVFMHNTAWRGWPVSLANSSLHDAQVLRDFKLPEGASGDDIDANGDGEVLAVLDLGTDESLVEAGLAREVVNRVQKLRKKAGLVASDVVDVFLNTNQQHPGGFLSHCMSVR